MSDDDPAVDIDAEAPAAIEPVDDTPTIVCVWCGGTTHDGPWGAVYFCNGCGKTIRRGETQREAWIRAREQVKRDRLIREQRAQAQRRPR